MTQPQKKRSILFSIITILLSLVLLGAFTPAPDAPQVSFATADCITTRPVNSASPTRTSVYVGSYEMGTPTGAIGSRDLYALNDNGTLRWRCTTSTSGGFSTAAVVDQGMLYEPCFFLSRSVSSQVDSMKKPCIFVTYMLRLLHEVDD